MTELNKEIIETLTPDKVTYKGTVEVAIEDTNKHRVTVSKFHNKATEHMFDFFAQCLAGEYKAAESVRPCMLGLFQAATNAGGGDTEANDQNKYWTATNLMSNFVHFDRVHLNFENNKTSATMHFRVPFIYLKAGKVHKLALYPAKIIDPATSMCAKHWLSTDIDVPLAAGNYTIVVDWTIELSTTNTSTTNNTSTTTN